MEERPLILPSSFPRTRESIIPNRPAPAAPAQLMQPRLRHCGSITCRRSA